MEVEFSLTPEDLQAFARFAQQRQKGQGARVRVSRPVVVWLGLLLLMLLFANGLRAALPGLLIGLAIGAFGALAIVSRLNKVVAQSQEEFANDKRNQWVFAPCRARLTPEEFEELSWHGRSAQRWEAIWDIGVTADHVFFCTTSLAAHIVPRRAFRDQQHFDEFVALARRYKEGRPTSTAITAMPPRPTTITQAPE